MRYSSTVLIVCLAMTSTALAQSPFAVPQQGIYFTANRGQLADGVAFQARCPGGDIFFNKQSVSYVLQRADRATSRVPSFVPEESHRQVEQVIVGCYFVGSHAVDPVGEKRSDYLCHYYRGSDENNWVTNVSNFESIVYRELYPGIDSPVRFYDQGGTPEFDFVVAPGADFSVIRMQFAGTTQLTVNESGELIVTTALGAIQHRIPAIYQERDGRQILLDGQFELLSADTVGFRVQGYDSDLALVIDPALTFSTYLGLSARDEALGVTADQSGIYVTGATVNPGTGEILPVPVDCQGTLQGDLADVFVTKFAESPTGLVPQYTTYLGGQANEKAWYVYVDHGSPYIAGETSSADFPVTSNAYDQTYGGSRDAFVAKLTSSGTCYFSTYLGGSGTDSALSLALDSVGDIYVAGWTGTDFPTTTASTPVAPGCSTPSTGFQLTYAGGSDGFISKLTQDGSCLAASTYFGGVGYDIVYDLKIDSEDNIYVCGGAGSDDFPLSNAIDDCYTTAAQGCTGDAVYAEAFIARLAPTLSTIDFSTFLGGGNSSQLEYCWSLWLKEDGDLDNIYVCGTTASSDFPTTTNAFQPALSGDRDAFAAQLRYDPTATPDPALLCNGSLCLVFSTFIGGTGGLSGAATEAGFGVRLGDDGTIFVSGTTDSADFVVTADAFQGTHGGDRDAFLVQLTSDGSAVKYGTYLGGPGVDSGEGRIAHLSPPVGSSGAGRIIFAGFTDSDPFPTKAAFDDDHNGDLDAFLAAFNFLEFKRGDANSDGTVDISDYIVILGYNFSGGTLACLDAADTEDSGAVTVGNAIYLANYLFTAGPPPPAPGILLCGEDPTADTLGCETYDGC